MYSCAHHLLALYKFIELPSTPSLKFLSCTSTTGDGGIMHCLASLLGCTVAKTPPEDALVHPTVTLSKPHQKMHWVTLLSPYQNPTRRCTGSPYCHPIKTPPEDKIPPYSLCREHWASPPTSYQVVISSPSPSLLKCRHRLW